MYTKKTGQLQVGLVYRAKVLKFLLKIVAIIDNFFSKVSIQGSQNCPIKMIKILDLVHAIYSTSVSSGVVNNVDQAHLYFEDL